MHVGQTIISGMKRRKVQTSVLKCVTAVLVDREVMHQLMSYHRIGASRNSKSPDFSSDTNSSKADFVVQDSKESYGFFVGVFTGD
jgi:hypothetical protein